jgi:hypothetical protein
VADLIIHDGYASIVLTGTRSFDDALSDLLATLEKSIEYGVSRVLVDALELDGFESPDVMQRYTLSTEAARIAIGKAVIAFVTRQEFIDPRRFGVLVAVNRGLNVQVFSNRNEAVVWLQGCPSPASRNLQAL